MVLLLLVELGVDEVEHSLGLAHVGLGVVELPGPDHVLVLEGQRLLALEQLVADALRVERDAFLVVVPYSVRYACLLSSSWSWASP